MNWRLGLDLGTNSIGWSVFSIDKSKVPSELVDLGVRIFSDGRDPKSKEPLAVERRTARGQRKIIYRRKIRRRKTFRLLQSQGLFPAEKEASQKIKSLDPWYLRVEALDRKLEPYELGRALFNLSVRRGFKSNRKDGSEKILEKNSSGDNLSQSEKINKLNTAIAESGARTLGEFLWISKEKNGGLRFAPGRMPYYPLRKMYEDEFKAIKEVQKEYYPGIAWDEVFDSIFNQRPLKPQERGRCQFMPENYRTFKAMPCAQKHRYLQDVFNLKYSDGNGKVMPLSQEQETAIIALMETKEKVTFKAIRKACGLGDECVFNLEANRDELRGNSTAVKMRNKKAFGSLWDELDLKTQDEVVEKLIISEEDSEVLDYLSSFDLSQEQKEYIVSLVFPSGTTMLCKEVSEQIVDKMIEFKTQFHVAVQMLGYKYAEQDVEKSDLLPYYGKILVGSTIGGDLTKPESEPEKKYGKIANPTVHVALNQTRTVVNALIKQYGKPQQISIELSRDLKASREAKDKMQKIQNENQKRNAIINQKIKEAFSGIKYPNRQDRLKYRLWDELRDKLSSPKCLYCGKEISAAELFTENIQIEHILPYSRTLLDAESNLTVAHASCNAFKKEKTPYEAFKTNPPGYNWNEILERANKLKPAKARRFLENAMEDFEAGDGFIARQLTDNAYLSKTAMKYLKAVCDDIWCVNGGMTKLIRDKWKIDQILKAKLTEQEVVKKGLKPEQVGNYIKNRYDHRHHALDAVVIGLTDRSLVQKISTMNAKSKKNRVEVPDIPINFYELVEKVKSIVVSFKPDHGIEGKLSKETLLGKIKVEEKISLSQLKEDDIKKIKNERVRNEIQKKFEEVKKIKDVQKYFKDIYPDLKIFNEYYVTRVPVVSLKKEEDVESIIDKKIREKLKNFINENKGKKFEDLLQEFSEIEWTGNPQKGTGKKYKIKKVRCKNFVQKPINFGTEENARYYAPEDYYAAIVWEIPSGKQGKFKYEAQYIRRNEFDKNGSPIEKKPHPAAKKLGIAFKGDYLEFSQDNVWYKCRIAGLKGSDGRFDIRPIYAVTDCYDWVSSTSENMLEKCWINPKNQQGQKGQNFISVNVLFGEKSARFITVNPIGRVFRKK